VRDPRARSSGLRPRLSLILLLVALLAAPAAVMASWLTQGLVGEVTSGEQPGGTVEGRVVDEQGRPLAGEAVRLWLVAPAGGRESGPEERTDAGGRFVLHAPAWSGHYELVAGGGMRQRVARGLSFLGRRGEIVRPRPVSLALPPGSVLELTFTRAAGGPPPEGHYELEGRQRRGLLFGLVPFGVRRSGTIADGRLRLDGIPPLKARLNVSLATGEELELELEIEPGLNARRVEL
jgi:hypothetical protein